MSERCKGMVFKESSGASGKIFKHSLSIAIETCHFQVQSGPSRSLSGTRSFQQEQRFARYDSQGGYGVINIVRSEPSEMNSSGRAARCLELTLVGLQKCPLRAYRACNAAVTP